MYIYMYTHIHIYAYFFYGNQMCNSLDDLLVVLNGVPEDVR